MDCTPGDLDCARKQPGRSTSSGRRSHSIAALSRPTLGRSEKCNLVVSLRTGIGRRRRSPPGFRVCVGAARLAVGSDRSEPLRGDARAAEPTIPTSDTAGADENQWSGRARRTVASTRRSVSRSTPRQTPHGPQCCSARPSSSDARRWRAACSNAYWPGLEQAGDPRDGSAKQQCADRAPRWWFRPKGAVGGGARGCRWHRVRGESATRRCLQRSS